MHAYDDDVPRSSPEPEGHRRVLGIDPGTRLMGWGVIEQRGRRLAVLGHGVLRAAAREPLPRRLAILAGALRDVVETHGPREAAIEETFHGRSARAALSLGEARGAAIVIVAEAGIPITGYANNVVKRAVTGGGRASKERVQAMVVRLLGLTEEPETADASDALALALCHLQRADLGVTGSGGIPPRLKAALRAAERGGRRR